MKEIFQRGERLLGEDVMSVLEKTRVIVFGVGGVGSWCVEGLVRSGIGHVTIVDSDCVSVTNINRQLMATTKTVGLPKVDVLRDRLLEINPSAEIKALRAVYDERNSSSFHLDDYDYVVDAIDSLKDKAHLIVEATRSRAKLFSSMGAALKLDVTRIGVAEFWNVKGCPLAAALRRKFKREKVFPKRKFKCVYSDELLENKGDVSTADVTGTWDVKKAQINGSLVHVTAIFGFTLAGLVIQDIQKQFNTEKR